MKTHSRPFSVSFRLGLLGLLPTLPLSAAVTANDDGDAESPFVSVGQNGVALGFSVTANDINAGDIFSFDERSASNATVLLALDGTGTFDARVSGDARALGPGDSLNDTFSYTVSEAPTAGVSQTLDPTKSVNTFGWSGLPAAVTASGPNLPSGITLAHELDGTAGATRGNFDGAQSLADASLEFWIRPDVVDAYQTLFETGGTGVGSGVYLNNDGTVSFLCKSGSNPFVQSSTVLTAGTWYHIVVVYDLEPSGTDSTFSLYIDGSPEGAATSGDASDWSGSDGAGLGQINNSNAGDVVDIDGVAGPQAYDVVFDGQIGLMRYYQGTALSAVEVANNFSAASGTDSATVTVEVTGTNDRPDGVNDPGGAVLEDGVLVNTTGLVANDGPVRLAPVRANLNYDAAVAVAGSLWPNIGLLQPTGGDLILADAALDPSPVTSRPGITAAIDFDDTTGGNAVLSPPPGTAIHDFPQGLDKADATFEFWAKLHPDDLTQISTLFETGGGTGFGLVVDNGVLQAATEMDGATQDGSFVSYDLVTDSLGRVGGDPTADFNHYVVTLDLNGGLELFVNGVSVASTTTGVAPGGDWDGGDNTGIGSFGGSNHGGFQNGASGTAYDTRFKGAMAAFRVYGGILTAGEIVSAYDSVAEPASDVLYANYDASVAGTASTWPNIGSLQPGTNGGDINFTNVSLVLSPGSARTQITKAYSFAPGGGGFGLMSMNSSADGLSEFPGAIEQNDLSLEFWVRLDANDLGQISTLFEAGGGAGVGLVVDNGVVKGAANIGLGEVSYDLTTDPFNLLSTPGDPTAEFFQVVLSLDLTNDRNLLYVNGTLVDVAGGNTSSDLDGGDAAGIGRFGESNHGGFQNGAAGTAYDTHFRGDMAIFRIYGGALTEAQVRQNYIAVDGGTDVDGDALSVTGIFDGSATLQAIGSPATLPSGAIVTLDGPGGAFTYDPNGAFGSLVYPDSATDTFTYQLSDGNGGSGTAEVEVVVFGRPDNLQPAAANATQTVGYLAGTTNVPLAAPIVTSDGNDGIVTAVAAEFLWNGVQTTFPGGGGAQDNDFGSPSQNTANGFALNLAFAPTAADLQAGTKRVLYQMGGTSNGHGIYLVDGVPHLLVKMQGGNGSVPAGLDDTDWAGDTISVPLTASPVAADVATDLALVFSLDQVEFSINGGAIQSVALANRGTKTNWAGNRTTTIGIRGSSGNTGGTSTSAGPYIHSDLSSMEGPVTSCRFWNASAVGTVIIDPDILTATLTINPAEGTLTVPPGASFDGTTWTYTGTPNQLNAALAALEFLPNGTSPVDVAVDIRDGEEDGAIPVPGTLTFVEGTTIELWRIANGFAPDGSGPDEGDGEDFDADTLANLLEFAFCTDPRVADSGPLNPDGTAHGTPTTGLNAGVGGVTFDALFIRRDDFGQSGSVSYTVEFSGDLVTFYPSTAPVTIVADSSVDPDCHVASVPYPPLLPNGQKARYFQITVTVVP